jgi:hypothetical protein
MNDLIYALEEPYNYNVNDIEELFKDIYSIGLILVCCNSRSLEHVKYYIKKGADPNFIYNIKEHKDILGRKFSYLNNETTPILEICNSVNRDPPDIQQYNMMKYLLEHGANPYIKDEEKKTPIQILQKIIDTYDLDDEDKEIVTKMIKLLNTYMTGYSMVPLLSKRSKHKTKLKLPHDLLRKLHEALV